MASSASCGRPDRPDHDPGLLLVGPAPPTVDAGDHLDPAKVAGVRTDRMTMSTYRSRTRASRFRSSSSSSSAEPQGARQTTLTGEPPRSAPREEPERQAARR